MNVLLQANEKYAKYMSVMLLSLFTNNKDTKINVYVIHSSISQETIDCMTEFVESYGNHITFLQCDASIFTGFKTSSYLTIEMYYKLLAHLVLPEDMDRVMFLDIDLIIDADLTEFYNTDFEGKYVIAAGQAPFVDYDNIDKNFDVKIATDGRYFNVGVLILNLKKFRENKISLEDYYKATEEIIKINPGFMYEQAIMNYMFGQYETKYLQVLEYNYRYHIEYENRELIRQRNFQFTPKIIHYANWLIQFKPWDLRFTEEELKTYGFEDIVPSAFNLNSETYRIMEIWWKYAEQVPSHYYDVIVSECNAKKDYFKSYVFNNLKRLRMMLKDMRFMKREELQLKHTFHAEISEIQKEFNCNYLEALGIMFRTHFRTDARLSLETNLNDYFGALYPMRNDVVIFLCAGDEVSKNWNKLNFLSTWNLKSNLNGKFRYSFAAVIDAARNTILEKTDESTCEITYAIPDTGCTMTLHSAGFNGRNFYSEIIMTEQDKDRVLPFSMSKRGLNICVFDKKTGKVCDAFSVDLFSDPTLTINRRF